MSTLLKLEHTHVIAAANRLRGRINHTPIIQSTYFNKLTGCNVYFKCENKQRTGAFKLRGALNTILQLPSNITSVVTHSSGNHALAVSKAAQMLNKTAHVIIPSSASQYKQNIVQAYDGQITICEPTLEAREAAANKVLAQIQRSNESSAIFVHPSNDENVIYGQGSIGLELLTDISELDCVLVPVGGGGLISGIVLSMMNYEKYGSKGMKKPIVVGCEPLGASDAYESKKARKLILQTSPNTIADGLCSSLGSNTFPIVCDFVDEIFTVDEDEIIGGMRDVFERTKMVIETSSSVGPAVLKKPEFLDFIEKKGIKNIAVVISGGNVDLNLLKTIF